MSAISTWAAGATGLACSGVDAVLGPRLSVLIFHRVLPQQDPLFPGEMHASRFDRLVGLLARHFRVLTLGEALSRLANGSLPRRAVAITFDDGYADNAQVAMPILQRHGVAATFFIASGFLNGGWMWNDVVIETLRSSARDAVDLSFLGVASMPLSTLDDRRRAIDTVLPQVKYRSLVDREHLLAELRKAVAAQDLGPGPMMSDQQLRSMHAAGMEIGAHTRWHPILACESDDCARTEIAAGREHLQHLLGTPVDLFAYPNGQPGKDYEARHVDMVRTLGFKGAVTTAPGPVTDRSDIFQWPRFSPWDRLPGRWLLRMVAVRAKRVPACTV